MWYLLFSYQIYAQLYFMSKINTLPRFLKALLHLSLILLWWINYLRQHLTSWMLGNKSLLVSKDLKYKIVGDKVKGLVQHRKWPDQDQHCESITMTFWPLFLLSVRALNSHAGPLLDEYELGKKNNKIDRKHVLRHLIISRCWTAGATDTNIFWFIQWLFSISTTKASSKRSR